MSAPVVFILGLLGLAILFLLSVKATQETPFDISEVYSSGKLGEGEEIKQFFYHGFYTLGQKTSSGIIVLTNTRFLFFQKLQGKNAHGADLVLAISWRDVKLIFASNNRVNITGGIGYFVATHLFRVEGISTGTLMDKVLAVKNSLVEGGPIFEAKPASIEESNKDNPPELLQKSLVRGKLDLSRKISLVFFIFIIMLFMLPMVTVSCAGTNAAGTEIKGIDFVTGKDFPSIGTGSNSRLNTEPTAVVALVIALIGILASLRKKSHILRIALGIAGIISMMAFKYILDGKIAQEGNGLIQADYLIAYWLVIISFGMVAIISFFMRDVENTPSENPTE